MPPTLRTRSSVNYNLESIISPERRKSSTFKRKTTSTFTSKSKVPKRKSNSKRRRKSSSSPRTSINHLPFDCFFIIFSRFSLRDLIPLRRVSHTWNANISQVCSRKERLTLFPFSGIGPHKVNGQDLYWIDELRGYIEDRAVNRHDGIEFRGDHLTIQNSYSFDGLGRLFEGVTELRIHYDVDLDWPGHAQLITQLIESFSLNQLISFRFWIPTNPKLIGQHFLTILYKVLRENLNPVRFPVLKQLDLCIVYARITQENRDYSRIQLDSNILSQLEHFSLDCYVDSRTLGTMLRKLGPRMTYLSLECENFHVKSPPLDLLDSVKFSGLTHLRLDNLRSSPAMLRLFCERFAGSLCFVQLKLSSGVYVFDDDTFVFGHRWFQPLTQLERLTELRLHSFKLLCNQVDDDSYPTPSQPLPSLPQVKKLTMCRSTLLNPYFDREKQKFDSIKFAQTIVEQFPNLEELILLCDASNWLLNNSIPLIDALEKQIRGHLYQYLVKLIRCKLDLSAKEFGNC